MIPGVGGFVREEKGAKDGAREERMGGLGAIKLIRGDNWEG